MFHNGRGEPVARPSVLSVSSVVKISLCPVYVNRVAHATRRLTILRERGIPVAFSLPPCRSVSAVSVYAPYQVARNRPPLRPLRDLCGEEKGVPPPRIHTVSILSLKKGAKTGQNEGIFPAFEGIFPASENTSRPTKPPRMAINCLSKTAASSALTPGSRNL